MGINLFKFSSCDCAWDVPSLPKRKRAPQDPNPKKFRVTFTEERGRFLIAIVQYPNCTNYEGKKILVFKGITEKQLRRVKTLDPHFCDSPNHISPIARFTPAKGGLTMARKFCDSMRPKRKSNGRLVRRTKGRG